MTAKSDVTDIYPMEELIPVVGKLAEAFTAKESSSVTYERARQLMEAVIYCIAHYESGQSESQLQESRELLSTCPVCTGRIGEMVQEMPPAEETYRLGYEAVIRKVKETQEKYNELMKFFDHYGNQNYRDTVEKALPGFFLYYDARYAPMDHIITMDYPVFGVDMQLEGIDRIRQYIDAIWEEQCYLMKFSRNDVISVLRSFHPRYEREYFNLREIITIHTSASSRCFL